MNIKETFLKLTEYTIPHGHEDKLEKYLPSGFQKDSVGNYFVKVGKSETLFTTHLDTYCDKYEKVNHVIDGNIIKTDGSTILGGDNKLGMTILLYMIDKGIPGTYYFFLSEEPISTKGGLWGSRNALAQNKEFFKKFKRAVAFDRKEMGSVVTRQKARYCCSKEFANELSKVLTDNGVESKPDPNAYYTDTATFLDTIPECTNISAGGYKEHYKDEWVDLSYTQKVADAACNIDWESLPTERTISEYSMKSIQAHRRKNKDVVDYVVALMNKFDLMHTNRDEYNTHNTETLVFNSWFTEYNIKITITNDILVESKAIGEYRVSLENMTDLYTIFGSIFGIDINYREFKIGIYEDDSVSILDKRFDSLDAYLNYFKSINRGKTSYVIKVGGLQYKDYDGDVVPKELSIEWLENNLRA